MTEYRDVASPRTFRSRSLSRAWAPSTGIPSATVLTSSAMTLQSALAATSMSLSETDGSVSYTHLDVYKRQCHFSSGEPARGSSSNAIAAVFADGAKCRYFAVTVRA